MMNNILIFILAFIFYMVFFTFLGEMQERKKEKEGLKKFKSDVNELKVILKISEKRQEERYQKNLKLISKNGSIIKDD